MADENSINPYYQEKEYLQHIFLRSVSGEELIFKGGTCLKICYGLPRFSEDLEFNTEMEPEEIKEIVKDSFSNFESLGIEVETDRSELFEENSAYTAHLRFKGPLHDGSRQSTNTIQIDAGKRDGTLLETDVKQVKSNYPDIPSYFLTVMHLREILAEKIAAMNNRKKGRDLFDIWFLINETEIDLELLRKKGYETERIQLPSREDYNRDLKDLLPQTPPYQKVRKAVEKEMNKKGLEAE
jgi:predicted nucleotidyltransferase component of viral defense system